MKKFTLALIAITSFNFINATSLVRRAARGLVSNRVTKTMVKPVSWITQTQFYKKHPWLAKGVGAYFVSVSAVGAYVVLDKKYKNYRERQRTNLLNKLRIASPDELSQLIKIKKIAPDILEETLFSSVLLGEDERVKVLIDAKVKVDIYRNGEALLHAAVEAEKLASLKRDLGYRARDYEYMWLPKFTNIVRHLIQANAPLNIQNSEGKTPLMVATDNGHLAMVKELIKAKADLNLKDRGQRTALHWAIATNNHPQIATALIDAKASLNEQDNDGNTPLILAAQHGSFALVRDLIAAGASVNIKNSIGNTALLQVVDHSQRWAFMDSADATRTIQELISARSSINAKNNKGRTALMYAVYEQNVEAVKALIAAEAQVNEKDQNGLTALMLATNLIAASLSPAIREVPLKLTMMLIEAGADVHAKTNGGSTALWHACDKHNLNCIAALLLAGAEIDDATKNLLTTVREFDRNILQTVIRATQNHIRSIRAQIPLNNVEPHMNIIADFLLGERVPLEPLVINGATLTWSPPNNDWSTVTPHMTKQPEFNFWETSEQVESKRNHAQAHSDVPGLS